MGLRGGRMGGMGGYAPPGGGRSGGARSVVIRGGGMPMGGQPGGWPQPRMQSPVARQAQAQPVQQQAMVDALRSPVGSVPAVQSGVQSPPQQMYAGGSPAPAPTQTFGGLKAGAAPMDRSQLDRAVTTPQSFFKQFMPGGSRYRG